MPAGIKREKQRESDAENRVKNVRVPDGPQIGAGIERAGIIIAESPISGVDRKQSQRVAPEQLKHSDGAADRDARGQRREV